MDDVDTATNFVAYWAIGDTGVGLSIPVALHHLRQMRNT